MAYNVKSIHAMNIFYGIILYIEKVFAYRTYVRYNRIKCIKGSKIMDKMEITILLNELYNKSKTDFEEFEKKIKEVIQEPSN